MAERKISVALEGRMDSLSSTLQRAESETEKHTNAMSSSFGRVDSGIMSVGRSLGILATGAIAYGLGEVTRAAKQMDAATIGLAVTARYSGENMAAANQAAKELSSDGLMSVTEASKALQNLLSRGFSLSESIELISRFKDSAAFGRQASLEFGEAIVTATEGLKNENSILVDNAGVTKNVSQMWKEYAIEHGTTADKLTQSQKRHAELNGILKETEAQTGNAARMSERFAGAQARNAQKTTELKETLGVGLQPALTAVLGIMSPVVSGLRDMVYWVETLGARAGGLYDKMKIRLSGTFSLPKAGEATGFRERNALIDAQLAEVDRNVDAVIADIVQRSMGGATPDIGADSGKRRTDSTPPQVTTAAEKARKQRELESDRKESMAVGKDMLDLFYKDQESRYKESVDTGSAMMDLFYKDLEARYKESAEYLNPLGQLTKDQQAAFDASSIQTGWAARNSSSDQSAAMMGARFAAEQADMNGDGGLQLKLDRIKQEEEGWIQSWAMQTDSLLIFEERRSLIEQMYSDKRKRMAQEETDAKYKAANQYSQAAMNLTNALFTFSGGKSKALFQINKVAGIANATVSTYTGAASAMKDVPYPYNFAAAASVIAYGLAQVAQISSTSFTSGGAAAAGGSGAGTASSPIVTQPAYGTSTGGSLNITVRIDGNVISDDRWVEERLAPTIRDLAVNRNVQFGFQPQ